jgi:peptide-methionine (S)-S-oxide reductase
MLDNLRSASEGDLESSEKVVFSAESDPLEALPMMQPQAEFKPFQSEGKKPKSKKNLAFFLLAQNPGVVSRPGLPTTGSCRNQIQCSGDRMRAAAPAMNFFDVLSGLADPGEAKMVAKEQALPGRMSEMEVSDKHFVFGTPMRGPWPEGFETIIFANGCFWGSEKGIWRLPGGGIHSTAVGYSGGFTPNPTYQEACSGLSGHTESVQVVFDPSKISAVDILRWFWEAHDPTSGMGQGNDRGTQYRSGLYYFNEDQKKLFEASKAAYEKALVLAGKGMGKEITTEIKAVADLPDGVGFYYAEDYHQQYLSKPGARPYCSAKPQGISVPPFEQWAPAGLEEKYAPKLTEDFWKQHAPKAGCSVVSEPNAPITLP